MAMDSTLLLIEDSPTDAAILTTAFQKIGWLGHVQIAQSWVEANEFLAPKLVGARPALPRLILLDLNLPVKPGHEVLRTIKGHPQWASIPTIILTSSSNPSDIEKSYKLHVNAYIAKPSTLAGYELIARRICDFWLKTVALPMT